MSYVLQIIHFFTFKVLYVLKISVIFCFEFDFVNFNLAPDWTVTYVSVILHLSDAIYSFGFKWVKSAN